jgi:hypothetical protein
VYSSRGRCSGGTGQLTIAEVTALAQRQD